MTPAARYNEAHRLWFMQQYPQTFKDGHYCPPKMPNVTKSNGLTTFIINYITWIGCRATRINTMGRLIETPVRQASGISLMTKKYMKSSTRKGSADISSTIRGRSVMFEIKTGKDRPSEYQLAEQARERRAGGVYEFIRTPEDFFMIIDSLMYG
ncbi:MAG: hypothetical protein JNK14_05695 [Chitinophagaceae bacterium]|nr:hypothetical protein [Chitinophagaceae bacterium]